MGRWRWSRIRRNPLADTAGTQAGIAMQDDIAELPASTLLYVARVISSTAYPLTTLTSSGAR